MIKAKNKLFIEQLLNLGFCSTPLPGGARYTHDSGLRIDFWPSSGKWTIVGTNVFKRGGQEMIETVKSLLSKKTVVKTRTKPPLPSFKYKPWNPTPTGPNEPPWET